MPRGRPSCVGKASFAMVVASGNQVYPNEDGYMPVPDPGAEGMGFREWEMDRGDMVVSIMALGNTTDTRRRAFSLCLVGDDARYTERPGATSPSFPGHDLGRGQVLREDWFPFRYQLLT